MNRYKFKFKVGDIVFIKKSINGHKQLIGHIAQITKQVYDNHYDFTFLSCKSNKGFHWEEQELEFATKEEILLWGL